MEIFMNKNCITKIGIIGAMELEVEALKTQMTVSRTVAKANMEFLEGTLMVRLLLSSGAESVR